jgi:hypothetical protein
MNSKLLLCVLTMLAACAVNCRAQTAPDASLPTALTPEPQHGEPNVRRTVIEDGNARIDEVRVRGQVQSVKVTPKVGPGKRYEIITGDAAGRNMTDGAGAGRSTVGKTVWSVLDF